MDRTASCFDAETLAQASTKSSTRRKTKKVVDRVRRVEFETFAVTLREEMKPSGTLETIYVERAIVAAWRLRDAVETDRQGLLANVGVDSIDLLGRIGDDARRETDRAERSLRRSLDSLMEIRGDLRNDWGRPARLDTTVAPMEDDNTVYGPELESNEWPIVPTEERHDPEPALDDDTPLPRWEDRLVFDFNVSDESPVVKGTWVTVAQIVSLIVDGQTWADILRSHPELSEEDIRVCLSYATEQENDDTRGLYLP
jgi:uncharacterized protein (DUF433 family)